MWFHHLVNLFLSSTHVFFSSLGTTVLGFVTVLLDSVVSIGVTLYRVLRKQGIDAVREQWRQTAKIALQTVLWVSLIIYGPIFIYSVAGAVYNDHQWQMSQRQELEKKIPAQEKEIRHLKSKLAETCYRPDRHLTPEQEHILYLALRDVAQATPANFRRIYMGTVEGDKDSQRFVQLFLWSNFENAGWKIVPFERRLRRKDTNIPYPGFVYADVSVTATVDQNTPEYKKEEKQIGGLLGALKQADIDLNQGLMDTHDPLRGARGFVIWINPKRDGPK